VAGYGMCGKGFSMRAKGHGRMSLLPKSTPFAPSKPRWTAFRVMPMAQLAPIGDIFCTVTGGHYVIRPEHFAKMKDQALCLHTALRCRTRSRRSRQIAKKVEKNVVPYVDRYTLPSGKSYSW